MQIPDAVLQLQHCSLLSWQDETMPSDKSDLGNGKQEYRTEQKAFLVFGRGPKERVLDVA